MWNHDGFVLMMWWNHLEGVPNSLLDSINILFEGDGDASLRHRRHFMRTCYVPRDVPESATNVASEIDDLILILNFTRRDSDITQGTVSHTHDENNSSFTDD